MFSIGLKPPTSSGVYGVEKSPILREANRRSLHQKLRMSGVPHNLLCYARLKNRSQWWRKLKINIQSIPYKTSFFLRDFAMLVFGEEFRL